MVAKLGITIGGYALAFVLFWLLLGAREDIGEIREQCNSEKLSAVAEAQKLTRETEREAAERRISQLEGILRSEAEARSVAILARERAENDALAAQMTIRELQEMADDETAPDSVRCLAVAVPRTVADSLR